MGGQSGGGARTPKEAANTANSQQILRTVHALCEGPIAGLVNKEKPLASTYFNNTPVLTLPNTYNFKGVEALYLQGTNDQAYLPGFDKAERVIAISTQLKQPTPIVRTIADKNVTSLRVTIGINRNAVVKTNGDTEAGKVEVTVQLLKTGQFPIEQKILFDQKSSGIYMQDVSFEELPAVPFELRVIRNTGDATSDRITNDTSFSSYTEIIDTKLSYPNTVMAAWRMDSAQFGGQVPNITYEVLGKIVKIPKGYNPEKRTYPTVWNGEWVDGWTNNPAFIFYDICTNGRYSGLAHQLGLNDIDLATLYAVAKYCDELVDDGFGGKEPRCVCNAYIFSERQAYDVLSDLTSVFQGYAVWNGLQMTLAMDDDRDITSVYTNANVVNGLFTYSGAAKKALHTAVKVSYANRNDNYSETTDYVQDDEAVKLYGLNVRNVTAFGCDSRGQAMRLASWILETELRQRDTVTFTVGREGLRHLPNDIIQIADNHFAGLNVGGKLVAKSGDTVTLDRDVENAVGGTIYFNTGSSVDEAEVTAQNGRVLTINRNLTVRKGTVWGLRSKVAPRLYRAVGIVENTKDGTYSITALRHDESKYGTINSNVKFPTTARTLDEVVVESVTIEGENGNTVLKWNGSISGDFVGYTVEVYRNGVLYSTIPMVDKPEVSLQGLSNGNYEVRIYGVTAKGARSEPKIQYFLIDYFIGGFRATPKTLAIQLDWVLPRNPVTTLFTEVWYSRANDLENAELLATLPYPQATYTMTGVGVSDRFYFWVRIKDISGNTGDFTSAVIGQSDTNPQPLVEQLQGAITKSALAQSLIDQLNQTMDEKAAAAQDGSVQALTNKLAEETEARKAAIQQEAAARVSEVNATAAKAASDLNAKAAEIGTRITAVENTNATQAQQITTLTTAQGQATAALDAERTARIAGDNAEAAQRTTLAARVTAAEGNITREERARVAADSAQVSETNALKSRVGNAESGITALQSTVSNNERTSSERITSLVSRVDNLVGENILVDSEYAVPAAWSNVTLTKPDLSSGQNTTKIQVALAANAQFGVRQPVETRTTSVQQGQTYTLSLNVQGTAGFQATGLNYVHLMAEGLTSYRLPVIPVTGNVSARPTVTFVAPWTTNKAYLLLAATGNMAKSDWFLVHSVKLERGSVATPWSRTPADILNAASGVEASLTQFVQTQTTKNEAQTNELNAAKVRIGNNEAAITNLSNTKVTAAEVTSIVNNTVNSRFQIPDTRSDNQPPSWYWTNHPKQTVREFKGSGTMGLSGGTFCMVETTVTWENVPGGPISQVAYQADGKTLRRRSDVTYSHSGGVYTYTKDLWTRWVEDETVVGSQEKANAVKAIADAANALATRTDADFRSFTTTYASDKAAQVSKVETLTAKVENLTVGGRNLLMNSSPGVTNANYAHYFTLIEAPKIDEDVTITLWGSMGAGRTGIGVYNSQGYSEIVRLTQVAPGVFRGTGKWKKPMNGATEVTPNNTRLNVYFYPNTATSNNTITRIKLERGTVGTDWSPAPEEVSASVSTVQSSVANLNGKVQSMYTVKTEAMAGNRRVIAGLALGADGATGDSQVLVYSNKFAIVDPTSKALKAPFTVVTENGAAKVALDGDLLATGTVLGKHIAANSTISAPKILGGSIDINNGTASINSRGQAYFADAFLTGGIEAKYGNFSGTVNANRITGDVFKVLRMVPSGQPWTWRGNVGYSNVLRMFCINPMSVPCQGNTTASLYLNGTQLFKFDSKSVRSLILNKSTDSFGKLTNASLSITSYVLHIPEMWFLIRPSQNSEVVLRFDNASGEETNRHIGYPSMTWGLPQSTDPEYAVASANNTWQSINPLSLNYSGILTDSGGGVYDLRTGDNYSTALLVLPNDIYGVRFDYLGEQNNDSEWTVKLNSDAMTYGVKTGRYHPADWTHSSTNFGVARNSYLTFGQTRFFQYLKIRNLQVLTYAGRFA